MDRAESANLLTDLPAPGPDEDVLVLVAAAGLRVERVVSYGHASPPGFHYDQPHAEWVALLAGTADLRFSDEDAARRLVAGDAVLIAPHRRHRVDRTDSPTVWLAVHFGPEVEGPAFEKPAVGDTAARIAEFQAEKRARETAVSP